nr:MAG TPA: hypothetical protein [Caudoviricetes sp.]
MARRSGHVWSSSTGWIAVKQTEARDYSNYEDAFWAFLIWTGRWY